ERGVAARIGVERRDAHQAVHAVLALEPAIGVVAVHDDGRRLDAGALAFGLFQPLDLVAVRLGPAHVHAHQHAGPILALGAAGAGVHFEIAVVGVGLARQQRLELAARKLGAQALERGFRLGDGLVVLFGFAELDQSELVVELLLDTADRGQAVLERVALAHHALGAGLVAPQIGVFGVL